MFEKAEPNRSGRTIFRLIFAAVPVVTLVTSGPAVAGLMGAAEVEHVRMNALAGGPTNAYDADLLKRYGCYSGTRSAFCEALAHPRRYERARRRGPQR
jgi:hypothetical protein